MLKKKKSPWFYTSSSSSPNNYFCVYCFYVFTTILLTLYSLQLGSLLLYCHSSCPCCQWPRAQQWSICSPDLTPQQLREDPSFLLKTLLSWSQDIIHFPPSRVIPLHSLSLPLICTPSPGNPPGPAFHLNANDPPKLVFPALFFILRSRLVYPPTHLLSPLEWAVRILTLPSSKQNFYCSLFKLSASQVFATQFFRPSPNSILTLCPINHQVL